MKTLDLGLTDYRNAYQIQKDLVVERSKNLISDTLVILEHPPIITVGRAGKKKNIIDSIRPSDQTPPEQDSRAGRGGLARPEIVETDRGGDVTCHYPGQIVVYPIIDLRERNKDIHKYLRDLEEVIINFLELYNINAVRRSNFTGVWVNGKKIASIGIGVKQWITYHGFALNIDSDLSYFDTIIPCGISNVEMTSLEKLLGKKVDRIKIRKEVLNSFFKIFSNGKQPLVAAGFSPRNQTEIRNLPRPVGTPPKAGSLAGKVATTSKTIPVWIKKRVSAGNNGSKVRQILADKKLNTVCQSAVCPNINECFNRGTATFMILGDVCTRNCSFCAVKKGKPVPLPDPTEPRRIAEAVKELSLSYVVITSVTRDDLKDGGAECFAETVNAICQLNSETKIELLIPDFQGNKKSIRKVVESKPTVIGHNIEMVPSLYPHIRPKAQYICSLQLLQTIKNMNKNIYTKSGLMLGLGEKYKEVIEVMKELGKANCDILTLGQYLQPNKQCVSMNRYLTTEEFKKYKVVAEKMGFQSVASGHFVRSSYHADKLIMSMVGK